MKPVTNEELDSYLSNTEYKKLSNKVLRIFGHNLDPAEKQQCFRLGVFYALRTYDPCKNVNIKTHIYNWIKYCCQYARKEMQPIRLKMPHLSNRIDLDGTIDLKGIVCNMNSYDQSIIKRYFYDNRTLEDIGKMDNVSSETIRRRLQRILKKMKTIISKGV
jgi:RNA polymerase sigma factor (sigma-70 family)